MNTHLRSSILAALAAAVITACGAPTSEPSPAAGAEPAPVEPTYEPAYPEDVSDGGLSKADVAQQPSHDHDESEHSHEEGDEHTHEDDDEHED